MNPIKLTIRGIPVEVSSPEDAWKLIELSQAEDGHRPSSSNGATLVREEKSAANERDPAAADPQAVRTAVEFLKAISGGGQAGVRTDRIIVALGVPHGRAIGGRLALVNKLLEEKAYTKTHVYSNKKTADGRIWKPRKSIEAAIATLEAQLKTLQ